MAGAAPAPEARVLITQCDDLHAALLRRFLHLRHPISGKPACYVVAPDGRLQELHWSKQRHTSWFIGNSICADGSLYLATPIDPLFVVLPILQQLRMKKGDDMGKFRSLDDIVAVDGYPGFACLRPHLPKSLDIICESREVGEDVFYRLDDSKVLAWLLCKVTRLCEALKASSSSSSSSSGVLSGLSPNELNVYGIKMLGEYVKMDPWLSLICQHLGVDVEALKTARVPFTPAPSTKGIKVSGPAAKKAALSKSSKQSGASPKITSFFSKPR